MKSLKLSKDLAFPIDAITQTFLVVGKRGSGKSNTAARLVEQFHHARLPFVVLDPVDTWWGLKAGRDGGKGLDVYVFGGRKADLPLEAGAGALIAEVLCEHRISMVLSVKHLSGRARSSFMVAFAQTLFQKWSAGPLHVVLEEAHELAPQMSGGRGNQGSEDNEAAMLGAFKRLWKLGRSSGIGGTAVTQRPASLSKDITTQSEILIAHRTIGPQDVKAIGEWVKYHGQHEEILGELPTLPTGEAFVWSPEFPEGKPLGLKRANILLRDTYDSASTPKVGEQRVEPKELADVDIERLRTKMSATLERAKAEDPKELKRLLAQASKDAAASAKRISELEAKISSTSGFSPTNAKAKPEVAALTDADRALIEKLTSKLDQAIKASGQHRLPLIARVTSELSTILNNFESAAREMTSRDEKEFLQFLEAKSFKKLLEKLNGLAVTPMPSRGISQKSDNPSARRPLASTNQAPPARRTLPAGDSNGDALPPAKQKILNALAFFEGIGVRQADKTQLALIVGVSPTSGGYFNNLGGLRSSGLIDYPSGGTVMLTQAGRAQAIVDGVPETTEELHAAIKAKLPAAKWKILEALIKRYPGSVPKDQLAEVISVSPTSGGYFNNLGSLRSLGLLDYPRPSEVVALPVLFLEGR